MGKNYKKSDLERAFLSQWRILAPELDPPEREITGACPPSNARLDFGFPEIKLGIEIHGGIWTSGRHTRGKGFWADRIKLRRAILNGWVVLEYVTNDVLDDPVTMIEEIKALKVIRSKEIKS